ncbi:hypothetical protein GW17_00045576 [Ensete ventricosum]|nr:hypothetical protein GW17_00045576 [Ensete ventricosum]
MQWNLAGSSLGDSRRDREARWEHVGRSSKEHHRTPRKNARGCRIRWEGDSRLQRGARKGGRLQGARKGLSSAANRGNGANRRGGCPLVGRLPAGKGSCRLRRGSGDGAN